MRCIAMSGLALALAGAAAQAADKPTRFWNLTRYTVSELYFAPAGTTDWGPNQCRGDDDGTVDHDERLRLTNLKAGRYDVKLKDVSGRVCVVRDVDVATGKVVTVEEKQLTACDH